MPAVFFYISGHGFGHASRQVEIVNAFGARDGGRTSIVIRSSAQRWLFERTVRVPFTLIAGPVDTGVVQIDSIRLDERATVLTADDFYRDIIGRAQAEAALLRQHDARFVVVDAPPLGCAAAAAAGIPSVVCANFTWEWIYNGYELARTLTPDLVPRVREAYRKAQAAWRMPMHGGFETFVNIVDIPFVARHARRDRSIEAVRTAVGLPVDKRLALVSFGGFGVNDLPLDRIDVGAEWGVVVAGSAEEVRSLPHGLYGVSYSQLDEGVLAYEDLVRAVDVVVSKPGYGIVSECVANETALLYTSRGHFVEYDVLVREMPRYLRCQFIAQEDLLAGRWREALNTLVAQLPPGERPPTNGAEVAAGMITDALVRSAEL